MFICINSHYHILSLLQIKKHKGPAGGRQTTLPASKSWSCLRSSPCRLQSRGSSLPSRTASEIWRTRCGTCSSSWARPGLRTSCWRGSSIATRWRCSTSKTLKAASHRLAAWLCPRLLCSLLRFQPAPQKHGFLWGLILTSTDIYYSHFQQWNVTKHIYLITVISYKFEVLELYFQYFNFVQLLLHYTSEEDIFTPLPLSDSFSY